MASRKPKPNAADVPDVEDLLSLMTDADSLWLWRRAGDRWTYIEARDPEAFRAAGVRETTLQRLGGGDYKARIRRPGGHWGEQRMFSIEGASKPAPRSATVDAIASTPARTGAELPSWIEKILIPLGVTIAGGIANKLLAEPKTDPLVLELLKQRGKGDAVDPIELQRLIVDAEARGEQRGKQLGDALAAAQRVAGGDRGESIVDVIREAGPIFAGLMNRGGPVPSPAPAPAMPARTALPTSTTTDILPAWLRPFMTFKPMVISAADHGHDPAPMAGMVTMNADDAMWAAIVEADTAGRLESDFYAAMPEMRDTTQRLQFASDLINLIREEIAETGASPADADPPAVETPATPARGRKTAGGAS